MIRRELWEKRVGLKLKSEVGESEERVKEERKEELIFKRVW